MVEPDELYDALGSIAWSALRWGATAFITALLAVLIGCCISEQIRTSCVAGGLGVLFWTVDSKRETSIHRSADGAL